eukprot:6475878-Amphidinium_carterae.2
MDLLAFSHLVRLPRFCFPEKKQKFNRVGKISRRVVPTIEEVSFAGTQDEILLTDGSGKYPAEPAHRRCGCGIAGETTKLSYPLPGCWQSVYRAELHAIMTSCEMMDGNGVIVADCKGAVVVANRLKAGLRKPNGRHSRIEARILASIGEYGDTQV